MARTRHIAGLIGLYASTVSLTSLPRDIRAALERSAIEASRRQRLMGPREDSSATTELAARGMTIREINNAAFRTPAEQLWDSQARALGVESWLAAIRA
jgi:TRAP-type C4-dicarboxylate transport system substrate-binding protein